MTPGRSPFDWLPAPPPNPPLPRALLRGTTADPLFQEYLSEMEKGLGRRLTSEEREQEWRLWSASLADFDRRLRGQPRSEQAAYVPEARPELKGTWARGRGMYAQTERRQLTRDQVRVEVWEERDRLHIGIQDKETGEYVVSWWDDEARSMFEQGFFKRGRGLEESVLSYAEQHGLLALPGGAPQTESLPQAERLLPPGIDSELEALVAQKRREWEGKGYHPGLIQKALLMAREWPAGLLASRAFQPIRGTPAEREVARGLYRMGFEVAERWLESMSRS